MQFIKRLIKYWYRQFFLILVSLGSLLAIILYTAPGLVLLLKISSLFLPGKLQVGGVSGSLLHSFSINHLRYADAHQQFHADKLSVDWQPKDLRRHQLTIQQLNAKSISIQLEPNKESPSDSKPLNFNMALQHVRIDKLTVQNQILRDVQLQANLENDHVLIHSLSAKRDDIQFNTNLTLLIHAPYSLEGHLQLNSLLHASTVWSGVLDLAGDINSYHLDGALRQPLALQVKGTFNQQKEIDLQVQWPAFSLERPNHSTISADAGFLKLQGNPDNLVIRLQASMQKPLASSWQMDATLQHKNLNLKAKVDSPEFKTDLQAKLHYVDIQHATLQMLMSQGLYHTESANLPFQGGDIQINLDEKALNAQGKFSLDAKKNLQFNLTLPNFSCLKATNPKQQIAGSLSANIESLDFIKNLNPLISQSSGQLLATLQARGTFAKPIVNGTIELKDGLIASKNLGMQWSPIQGTVTTADKQWQLKAQIGAANQALLMDGKGTLSTPLNGKFQISGKEVPLINTTEYQIKVSPDLQLTVTANQVALNGKLLIPSAHIAPQTFENSVELSSDVILVENKPIQKEKALSLPLLMNVDVVMGDAVSITVKGLQGLLQGDVHVLQSPNTPLNASGQLNVINGKYQAYGQNLKIEQGQLLFTGGLITNPGIEVRAIRQFSNTSTNFSASEQLFDFNSSNLQTLDFGDKTTVGIQVSGHLKNPKIQLFSSPSTLSQADILSMLLLGKPANQANKAGGQLLLAAISSMNLGKGSSGMQLLSQLKQKLGLDFDLQNNTQYDKKTNQTTESTSLMVGKSLSKRLYISYNAGLSQTDSNVLTLKYLLNKFFSVQVNASLNASGIDLLYTHQKD